MGAKRTGFLPYQVPRVEHGAGLGKLIKSRATSWERTMLLMYNNGGTGSGMGKEKYFWGVVISLTLTLTLSLSYGSYGGERKPIKPSPKDKCPVCGMFVSKYPDFLSEILFKDGTSLFFDGTKDMFKCYLNLKKYQPSKKQSDIDSIYVKDYYRLAFIDGTTAYYVTGSDVFGPMGRELIPFEKEADAKEFMKDHKGQSLLRFRDVTMEIVRGLD